MTKIWLSHTKYANCDSYVDHLVWQLKSANFEVELFSWEPRDWENLADQFVGPPTVGEEPCAWIHVMAGLSGSAAQHQEDIDGALQKAYLAARRSFTLVALFPKSISLHLIPKSGISFLCMTDDDGKWIDKLKNAGIGGVPKIDLGSDSFFLARHVHRGRDFIEVRPHIDEWQPIKVGIPHDLDCSLGFLYGPASAVPIESSVHVGFVESPKWLIKTGGSPATPSMSYYIYIDGEDSPRSMFVGASPGPHFELDL